MERGSGVDGRGGTWAYSYSWVTVIAVFPGDVVVIVSLAAKAQCAKDGEGHRVAGKEANRGALPLFPTFLFPCFSQYHTLSPLVLCLAAPAIVVAISLVLYLKVTALIRGGPSCTELCLGLTGGKSCRSSEVTVQAGTSRCGPKPVVPRYSPTPGSTYRSG